MTTDPNLQASSSAESSGMIDPSFTDLDEFELMKNRKRSVGIMAVCIGIPVLFALALYNLIKGYYVQTFLCSLDFLIAVLLGFMTKRKTDEEFEYKIYSILFRLFIAVIGIAIIHQIGFHSSFSQIEWCYVYPILIFFAVGSTEGIIWVFAFYGILAFLILNFDLQRITLLDLQELKYRFLVSFFVVSMLSLSLQHGLRFAQQRLLSHQRNLKESENRYRQAYEQLSSEMQERKQAEEALQRSENESKRLAQENAVMAEIGRIISSTLNIEEVYERFVEKVHQLIPFDRTGIQSVNPRDNTTTLDYVSGVDVEKRRPGDIIPLEGTAIRECVRTRSGFLFQTDSLEEVQKRFPALLPTFKAGLRSMICVPLISKDEVIGVFHLRSLKLNAYTVSDLKLAERVGNQIAGAIANAQLFIERKRAEEEVGRLSQENAIMAEMGRIISSTLNIEEVYEGFAEKVRELIPFDRIVINLIDTEKGIAPPLYVAGKEIGDRKIGDACPLEGSGTAEMVRTKSSLLIQTEDFDEYKDRFPMLLSTFQAGFRSIMNVPLFSKGRIIGALLLRSLKPYAYTDEDVRLAEKVGNQIAGAIASAQVFLERTRVEGAAKRLSQENAIMAEIGRIISSTLNIEEVYERFVEKVRKLIPFDRTGIQTINPRANTTTIDFISGVDVEKRRPGDIIPLEGTAIGECVRTRSGFLFQTDSLEEVQRRFPGLLPTFKAGLRSMICVPLISKDSVIGVFHIHSLKSNAYTVSDLKLAERVGNQIAGAIANAQLFIERKRAVEEVARLSRENAIVAEIGRIISSTLEIDQVYAGFADAVRHLMGFDRISIGIIDAEHHTAAIAYAIGKEMPDRQLGEVFPLSESVYEHVLKTRSSVLVQTGDIREMEKRYPFLQGSFRAGFRSLISVPLISKDQVIGALNLRSFKPNVYADRDLKIAESIGIQISGAIANALLFAKQKCTEEALRESERKFRDLYDHAPLGYHEYNSEGLITNVNRTDLEMLGYTADEMIGRPMWKFNVEEDNARKQILAKLAGTLPPGRNLERIYRRKDGTTFPVLIEDRLILDEKGCIKGIRCMIQDITERKRMEVALQEKTKELAQSNEDLEQFAYVASHDLQEPLRMVASYVQLLARRYKGKLDSDANEFIDFAVDGAVRMRKLISDLLTYSRVGTQGKELSPTDTEAVLGQSINDLKVAIEENGALVTHDPLPTVMADRSQLGQLLQNLIGNAIKFRSNEPPRVHISASRNGNGWTFSVRDNGIGIAPEYAERIFIIFQRLHSRQKYAGTGIGLAICKKIVDRHGGRIWVESEVGKGATFYFALPEIKAEPLSS